MGRKADECVLNPEKFYKTPEAVLADNNLTQEQKDKILHCWEQDEISLMRADEENMSLQTKTDAPQPAELLKRIKDAETKLENAGSPHEKHS